MISATTISPLNRKIVDGGVPPFPFGNALQFDGVNDYVSFATQPNNSINQDFIISIWFKTSDTGIGIRIKVPFFGELSGSWLTGIGVDDGKFALFYFDGTSNKTIGSTSVADGVWHHALILRNKEVLNYNSKITVWIDGVLELNAVDFNVRNFDTYLRLNQIGALNPNYANVILDSLMWYWGSTLTATLSDAQYIYNNSNGRDPLDLFASAQIMLDFNESSGASVAVNRGVGGATYNGTLNNFNTATCWVAH